MFLHFEKETSIHYNRLESLSAEIVLNLNYNYLHQLVFQDFNGIVTYNTFNKN